jgi:hypothetical protein
MCPKNEVNVPSESRPVLQTVKRVLGNRGQMTVEEELRDLRALSGKEQKAVRTLLKKAELLKQSGMLSSAARLESQALQTVRRHRRAAQTGPNPVTGA